MNFKNWLENNNKKILLLIHPDCIFELGFKICKEYEKKLIEHSSKFDYVISHCFWPKHMIDYMMKKRNKEETDALDSIIKTIKNISDKAISPEEGGCSYNKELPEYLIENNANIFMGGGYEDNCLWRSYVDLFKKLDWIIKEKNIIVKWYKPLIFRSQNKNYAVVDDYEIEQDKKYISMIDAKPSNFHPKKVDYQD